MDLVIMFFMISGFSEQWQCPAGEWTVWAPDATTKEAMRTAPDLDVCTSYVQADHLRMEQNWQAARALLLALAEGRQTAFSAADDAAQAALDEQGDPIPF